MAKMNFGGVMETVATREEFTLEMARKQLEGRTIACIGYGVQGPGQSLNLKDNGINVIVGQRAGKTFDKAVGDGWVPGKTLFSIEEACEKATVILQGPSVPLCPELLELGIDRITGMAIADRGSIRERVERGLRGSPYAEGIPFLMIRK